MAFGTKMDQISSPLLQEGQQTRIPVVEESLEIGVMSNETGAVRVRTIVHESDIEVPLECGFSSH